MTMKNAAQDSGNSEGIWSQCRNMVTAQERGQKQKQNTKRAIHEAAIECKGQVRSRVRSSPESESGVVLQAPGLVCKEKVRSVGRINEDLGPEVVLQVPGMVFNEQGTGWFEERQDRNRGEMELDQELHCELYTDTGNAGKIWIYIAMP